MPMEADPPSSVAAEHLRGSQGPGVWFRPAFEHDLVAFDHDQNQKIVSRDGADKLALALLSDNSISPSTTIRPPHS